MSAPEASDVPTFLSIAQAVLAAYPVELALLRKICDVTDARRNAVGENDPQVEDGVRRANDLKAYFTRRIAYAVYQKDQHFGLRFKPNGANGVRPVDDKPTSTDALLYRRDGFSECRVVDVMSDRDCSWNVSDTQPEGEWMKPLPEQGEEAAPPPPAPVPEPDADNPVPVPASWVDLTPVLQAIIALGAQIDSLHDTVEDLANRPTPTPLIPKITFPDYSARVAVIGSVTLRPVVK